MPLQKPVDPNHLGLRLGFLLEAKCLLLFWFSTAFTIIPLHHRSFCHHLPCQKKEGVGRYPKLTGLTSCFQQFFHFGRS